MRTNEADRDPVLERFIDRATAQISVPAQTVAQPRRLRLLPLLGSVIVVIVAIAAAVVVGRIVSEMRSGVAGPSLATATVSGTPAREPITLAQLSWESTVLDAFRAGGLSVRTIGGSTEEGALGVLLPARAFIVSPGPSTGGFGAGADVIFVKGAGLGAVGVCESQPSAQGRHSYLTYVGGKPVRSEDAVAPVYHLVSAEYYVIAYDAATRDALQRGLGLLPTTCP